MMLREKDALDIGLVVSNIDFEVPEYESRPGVRFAMVREPDIG